MGPIKNVQNGCHFQDGRHFHNGQYEHLSKIIVPFV